MKQCAIKITGDETKWDSLKEYDQESESADLCHCHVYKQTNSSSLCEWNEAPKV